VGKRTRHFEEVQALRRALSIYVTWCKAKGIEREYYPIAKRMRDLLIEREDSLRAEEMSILPRFISALKGSNIEEEKFVSAMLALRNELCLLNDAIDEEGPTLPWDVVKDHVANQVEKLNF
jgi:hypothetical protein